MPWRSRLRSSGRLGKVPQAFQGTELYPHNPLDPEAWMTLGEAHQGVASGRADGVGVVLTPDLGWFALDVDHCRGSDGRLAPTAQALLDALPNTYAEVSPSGTGVHLLLPGRVPVGRYRGFELIERGYLTVTGQALQAMGNVPDDVRALARWQVTGPQGTGRPSTRSATPRRLSRPHPEDDALIDRAMQARNGALFSELWAGGLAGYPSRSEGDLAFALLLLYWVGDADVDRADRLFRKSGRARDRWDLPAHDPYSQRTWTRAQAIRAARS